MARRGWQRSWLGSGSRVCCEDDGNYIPDDNPQSPLGPRLKSRAARGWPRSICARGAPFTSRAVSSSIAGRISRAARSGASCAWSARRCSFLARAKVRRRARSARSGLDVRRGRLGRNAGRKSRPMTFRFDHFPESPASLDRGAKNQQDCPMTQPAKNKCGCGCGRDIPPGRLFATKAHANRAHAAERNGVGAKRFHRSTAGKGRAVDTGRYRFSF